MNKRKKGLRLQTTIILLVCSVVLVVLIVTHLLIGIKLTETTRESEGEKAMTVARTVAHSPYIISAMKNERPKEEIQDYVEELRTLTFVDFIVVLDMNGIRQSHPDRSKIGEPFVGGDEIFALEGNEHISISQGTLGRSLRAFAPLYDETGNQLGAVAVGIAIESVAQATGKNRSILYIGMVVGLLIGILGATLLAKRIKRILFGLEPATIAQMLEEQNAMLESTREGILTVNQYGQITLANAQANQLFSKARVQTKVLGEPIEHYMPIVVQVLNSGEPTFDYEMDLNGVTIVINSTPLYVNQQLVGVVSTFRDKTEIKMLAEQLSGVKSYANALRAQTHEFMNKLHVIMGMVHLKAIEEIPPYIMNLTNSYQQEVGFVSQLIKDPVLAGFLLGKMSYARENGCNLLLVQETVLPKPQQAELTHEVIKIVGNLIDNSLQAIEKQHEKIVKVTLIYKEKEQTLEITVSDSGSGIDPRLQAKVFKKGFSTKGENRGLGLYLIKQSVTRLNGQISIDSKKEEGTTVIVCLPYPSKGDDID
ncbi:DcuS/MalK family sensor histidine kinase [Halalkalibacter kiskunsagensis]|uniref:histidine kinase n=1 Tax=Halalkalibacter kiskunsagensis TaxID=1548599 RepID=A0ABV6K868_9BACI